MKVEPTPSLNPQKQLDAVQLLTNPQMQLLFQKIGNEYLYWDKVKYIVPKGVDKQVLWQAGKIQRQLSAQCIKFGNYKFYFTNIWKKMKRLKIR